MLVLNLPILLGTPEDPRKDGPFHLLTCLFSPPDNVGQKHCALSLSRSDSWGPGKQLSFVARFVSTDYLRQVVKDAQPGDTEVAHLVDNINFLTFENFGGIYGSQVLAGTPAGVERYHGYEMDPSP